jgi:branched-chain amino acid transport system substrate-binding protein
MKKTNIIIIILIASVAVCASFYIKNRDTVRIGVLVPLSGPGATLGQWMQKGVNAAQEEINANGGINGKKLELVIQDDGCVGATAIAAYRNIHDVKSIKYFVGPLCAAARVPVLKSSEADHTLLITTGLAVTYGQDTTAQTFNVLPSVSYITEKILKYAYASLDSKKISLLSLDDEYGKETDTVFVEKMKEQGVTKYNIEKFNKGTSDMRTQIIKLSKDDSDTVLVAGFTADYAVFMKQAAQIGLNKKIIALSPIQAPDAANANKGTGFTIYYPHPSSVDSSSAKEFLAEYKQKDPSVSEMSPVYLGSGYDAVKLLAIAISKCGDDTTCSTKQLASLSDYPGANGSITFGDKGNVNSSESIEIRKLENGMFSRVK